MSIDNAALMRATSVGTILQLAMVLAGHRIAGIALLFAPMGMAISLLAGLLYARWSGRTSGAWAGGALAGGICALIGTAVSFGLGDVTAVILAFGTLSSAVTGAIGGWLGARVLGRAVAAPR